MPLARLYIPADLAEAQARGLADAVHDALVATCGVPPEDRFQLILRQPAGSMILDPHYGEVSRSERACVVEVLLLGGRTNAHKRALYQQVAASAVRVGLRADDVLLALSENAAIDWSLGGGKAFDALEQAPRGALQETPGPGCAQEATA